MNVTRHDNTFPDIDFSAAVALGGWYSQNNLHHLYDHFFGKSALSQKRS
jgi:hypothetical protein